LQAKPGPRLVELFQQKERGKKLFNLSKTNAAVSQLKAAESRPRKFRCWRDVVVGRQMCAEEETPTLVVSSMKGAQGKTNLQQGRKATDDRENWRSADRVWRGGVLGSPSSSDPQMTSGSPGRTPQ
jgi:hypothetical protein